MAKTKALTEDSETAASLSELRDWAVQHTESEYSTRTAEDLRCYFLKNSVMRTRRSVLVGVSSALILAGCTESDPESTTDGDDDSSPVEENDDSSPVEENDESSPVEENLEISNPALNGQPLGEYDVDFPADVTPEQLADEFQHQLEYETQGANGPVESTVEVEYTENTIPTEDEGPLDEQIANDEYQTGDITQDIQFPDHLVEHLIENPRNIQATLTAEDTETGQTTDREFTLNYADQFAENGYREAFDPSGYIDSRLGQTELVDLEVEDGVISIEYNSDHEIGTDDFNLEFSGAGVYTGIVDETRTAYELDWTVNDANGETYHEHIENDLAEEYLNGEPARNRRSEMLNEIMFERLNT